MAIKKLLKKPLFLFFVILLLIVVHELFLSWLIVDGLTIRKNCCKSELIKIGYVNKTGLLLLSDDLHLNNVMSNKKIKFSCYKSVKSFYETLLVNVTTA